MMQHLFIVSAGAFLLRDAQVPTTAAPVAVTTPVAPAVVTTPAPAVPAVGAAPAALSPEAAAQQAMTIRRSRVLPQSLKPSVLSRRISNLRSFIEQTALCNSIWNYHVVALSSCCDPR